MIISLLAWIFDEKSAIRHIKSLSVEFISREWESRIEIAVKSAFRSQRNLPYAEETKDMIDTECVKILRHLRHT